MLLAIDTSAGSSVAIVERDAGVLVEVSETSTMRHAETIGVLIAEVLARSGVAPSELSGVTAGMGPGPFTGLRVGIAAARAFAFGVGLRVTPVISHDALACERYDAGHEGPLLVVTDARRNERYWSAYSGRGENGVPLRIDDPGLSKPAEIPHPEFARYDATTVSAGQLGIVAQRRCAAGLPAVTEEPLYLRSPDVTLSAGPKRVSR